MKPEERALHCTICSSTNLGSFAVYKVSKHRAKTTPGTQKTLGNHKKIINFWYKMTIESTPNTKNNYISDEPSPMCCLQNMEPKQHREPENV